MSTFCPPVVVDLVTYTPTKYGLLSVAKPFPNLDSHWRTCGVQFTSTACAQAQVYTENCTSTVLKATPPEPSLISADPFEIFASWECGVLGKSEEQHRTDALNALDCDAERALEFAFYAGTDVNSPKLVGGGCTTLNTAATPVSVATGIGLLEGAMGVVQCGEATLHFPRELGALAARYNQTYGSGGMLRSAMGSPLAFGTGYGNEAPDGTPAPAGVAWVYATGPVYYAETAPFMNPPTFDDAVDRSTNQLVWEATKTVLLAVDGCACFAVAVVVGESGGGGGGGAGLTYPSP